MTEVFGILGFPVLSGIFLAMARIAEKGACGKCPDRPGGGRCPTCPFREPGESAAARRCPVAQRAARGRKVVDRSPVRAETDARGARPGAAVVVVIAGMAIRFAWGVRGSRDPVKLS